MHCNEFCTTETTSNRGTNLAFRSEMVEQESPRGGCYGSTDLAIVAYKRSWSPKFCENRPRKAETENSVCFSPGLSIGVCGFLAVYASRLWRYALIMLPYGQQGFAPSLPA